MAISVVNVTPLAAASSGTIPSVAQGDTVFIVGTCFNLTGAAMSSSSPTFNGSPVTGAVQLCSENSAFVGGVQTYATLWMLPDVPSAGTTVALTFTNNDTLNSAVGLIVLDVAGLGASPTSDANVSNPQQTNGNSGSIATGTLTTSGSPDILIGGDVIANGGQAAGSAGFTSTGMGGATFAGYLIESSSGATASWSATGTSSAWSAFLAAITATASGGTQADISQGSNRVLSGIAAGAGRDQSYII